MAIKIYFKPKRALLFGFLMILFITQSHAQEPEWLLKLNKIRTFKSTKTEIEKLFDQPTIIEVNDRSARIKNGWGKTIKYQTKDGILEVDYSTGNCAESKSLYGYDVEDQVAVGVSFYPNKILYDNQLNYDLNKFEIKPDKYDPNSHYLSSKELAVHILVSESRVKLIQFTIEDKHKKFACKNVPDVEEPIWLIKLRSLSLFKSTRAEVEKIFNKAKIIDSYDSVKKENDWGVEVEYETIYGKLEVEYSTGNCSETKSKYGLDIEKNVVVEMRFSPKKRVFYTEANFDFRELESEPVTDVYGTFIYTKKDGSLRITLVEGEISRIEFSLTNEQYQKFDCENVLKFEK